MREMERAGAWSLTTRHAQHVPSTSAAPEWERPPVEGTPSGSCPWPAVPSARRKTVRGAKAWVSTRRPVRGARAGSMSDGPYGSCQRAGALSVASWARGMALTVLRRSQATSTRPPEPQHRARPAERLCAEMGERAEYRFA